MLYQRLTSLSPVIMASFLLARCYYDATPPSEEEKREYLAELIIRVNGLNPEERLLYFFREPLNFFIKYPSYLYPRESELYFSHLLGKNIDQLEIQLIIDQNQNGEAEPHEPYYHSPPLHFSVDQPKLFLIINRSHFTP
ncbi:MAG: hypothetical protein NZM25_02130 [Leptospiraceae bacterium]|nr:hypothetical protein [Leptospiraceae bacterium]MDW8306975.1 hypothetical protein [Leptospiraceae bacterium]